MNFSLWLIQQLTSLTSVASHYNRAFPTFKITNVFSPLYKLLVAFLPHLFSINRPVPYSFSTTNIIFRLLQSTFVFIKSGNCVILSLEEILVTVATVIKRLITCSLFESISRHLKSIVFLSIGHCLKTTTLEIHRVYVILWIEKILSSLVLSNIWVRLVLSLGPLSNPLIHSRFSKSDMWFSLNSYLFSNLSCNYLFMYFVLLQFSFHFCNSPGFSGSFYLFAFVLISAVKEFSCHI